MRKRAIEGRKIRIYAVMTAATTRPRMRHDRPNAGRRRSERTDSAWTVTSAAMLTGVYRSRASQPRSAHGFGSAWSGRGDDPGVDAIGGVGRHEPQPVAASIVRLVVARRVGAAFGQRAVDRAWWIGRGGAGRDTGGIGLAVGIRRGRTRRRA